MIRCWWLVPILALAACNTAPEPVVRSHVSGLFTVADSLGDADDWSGFEITITQNTEAGLDTLGFAISDSTGRFAFDVESPVRGIYSLMVSRGQDPLAIAQIALAEGDSARLAAQFPLGRRRIRITSPENAAWLAYRNAKAQYSRAVSELAEAGAASQTKMSQVIGQTSSVMWSLRSAFPGTFGAELAATESVVMLDGWNDSLVTARYEELGEGHPNALQLVRAARRARARAEGQDSALALIRRALDVAPEDKKAGLYSEIVLARLDSQQTDLALTAARELMQRYPDSEWAGWAERAEYEMTSLMPGMEAPTLRLVDASGDSLDTASYRGQMLVLEFYDPSDVVFQRELPGRDALLGAIRPGDLTFVSLSVSEDSLLNEALLDGRDLAGRFVFLPEGLRDPAATAMNINVVPTRIFVDQEGRIIGKYVGPALQALATDIAARFAADSGP